jgi:hypothetical protein
VVKSVGRGVFLGCFAGIRVVDPDTSCNRRILYINNKKAGFPAYFFSAS